MIRVVASLIIFESSVLVAKRKSTSTESKNLWEFPGGKVEPEESDQAALARELMEELQIKVEIFSLICKHQFKNSKGQRIELLLYETLAQDFDYQIIEHDEAKWVTFNDIEKVDFLDSNKVFVSPVQDWLKARGFL